MIGGYDFNCRGKEFAWHVAVHKMSEFNEHEISNNSSPPISLGTYLYGLIDIVYTTYEFSMDFPQ